MKYAMAIYLAMIFPVGIVVMPYLGVPSYGLRPYISSLIFSTYSKELNRSVARHVDARKKKRVSLEHADMYDKSKTPAVLQQERHCMKERAAWGVSKKSLGVSNNRFAADEKAGELGYYV